jgi:2-keto-4-pentenoate hydratase/2-oxohepta-3-ene-1,7-dioic acid hydratase in catechol pathway
MSHTEREGIDGMKLDVRTKLYGRFEEQGNTSEMLLSVNEMVANFSSRMTLLLGDTIAYAARRRFWQESIYGDRRRAGVWHH